MHKGRVEVSFERRDRGDVPENGLLIRFWRMDHRGGEVFEEFWLTFDQANRLNQHLSRLFQLPPGYGGLLSAADEPDHDSGQMISA